jgi:hypothetical protein
MLTVYHGATTIVDSPLVSVGRENLDFGKGFYITDIREQAENWGTRAANIGKPQWLNIYHFDLETVRAKYRYLRFEAYNKEWLDFIVGCRRGLQNWQDYDVIEGGVADDRVIDTVNLYMLGILPEETALERLAYHQPNNQFCIINQEVVDKHLNYIKAEPLNGMAQLKHF